MIIGVHCVQRRQKYLKEKYFNFSHNIVKKELFSFDNFKIEFAPTEHILTPTFTTEND